MYTLDDIDEIYPVERYGTLYAELFKEHYGHRPHSMTWPTVDDFLEEFDRILDDDFGDTEDEQEEETLDWLNPDALYEEQDLLFEAGFDRRMNRDDEWD